MIKQQQKRRKEYNLVFIDLAKAFNTIPHKSIDKGLWRKGIPEQVRETLMEVYSGATTRISIGEKVTRQIKIRAGVKQGHPLSPLLFNLIIDELLEKLKKSKVGIKIREELLYCITFADDLVLLTEDRIHMQMLIEASKEFLDEKGLQANAGKCASLRVVPVPMKKLMKVIIKSHRQWGTDSIPSITFKDLVKYLGVEIQPDRTVKLPRALWKRYLKNLSIAHLNPIQKVEGIRQVIVAKIQHQLKLSDHRFEETKKINRLIWKYVKKILHLPTWTNTTWIHHRNRCNIPDLLTTTMIKRAKATTKMKISKDKIAQCTGDVLTPINQ